MYIPVAMVNQMIVEKSGAKSSKCYQCGNPIAAETLRVTRRGNVVRPRFSHLRCFRPAEASPVSFDSGLRLRNVTEAKDVERVRKWVDRWNRKFVVTEENVPRKYLTKKVATEDPRSRRILLIVFQYLTTKESELLVAIVCKSWFHTSRDEELWKDKYLLDFNPSHTDSGISYRRRFIAVSLGSCWHCKRFVHLEELQLVCPMHMRPLCKKCSRIGECYMMTVNSYRQSRLLEKSIPEMLKFPVFKLRGIRTAYVSSMRKVMVPYAERRRDLLIEMLETEYASQIPKTAMQMIEMFPVSKFYDNCYYPMNSAITAIVTFFGENEQRENLQNSVEAVANALKSFNLTDFRQI